MANFQNNAITESGILLRSHVDMGAVFTATRIVMGSGYIPTGKTAKTMTAVVSPVKELTINKKQRSPDGKVIFGGVYTNEDVTTEFYFRELALYAKAVYPDGTEIAEVLYSYGNAAGSAELMAAYSTSTVVERQMDIVTFVGSEAQIDLIVESGLHMSHADKHSADGEDPITPESIGAVKAFGKYVAGSVAALDNLTGTGNYSWLASADNPFGAMEGSLFVVVVDCPNYGGNPVVVQTITQTYAAGGTLPLGSTFRRTFYQIDGWSAFVKIFDGMNKPNARDVGALPADIITLDDSSVPKNWASVWSLPNGVYSWVQNSRLIWEPEETPVGALRVTLEVIKSVAGSGTVTLRYIDGAKTLTEYIGESYGNGGRWAQVYNTNDAIRIPDKTNAGSGGKVDSDNGVSVVYLSNRNDDNSARNALIINPYSEADIAGAIQFARGANGAPSEKYKLYGEHFSPAVTATAELV